MRPLVVGFDLDLTLIDSRPGIHAVYRALAEETGVPIDADLAVTRLGPPLDDELVNWFPAAEVTAMAERFRELYPALAVAPTAALPGAEAALAAVRAQGGRSVVVTGKFAPNARLHLEHLGLAPDELVGRRWGDGKEEALRERGAAVYVGDHEADMRAARAAGAVAVGVTTGPADADALRDAGADLVLEDLTGFPAWLEEHLLQVRLAALQERLRDLGSVLVAFSGGADSAFLLAAAVDALGPYQVVAATAVSPSLPAAELDAARALAAELGVRHLTPRSYELAREGYRANGGDRCYACRAELMAVLTPAAASLGIRHVVTGTNADDAAADFRPGIDAAAERGALTPLLDAGLTKAQVRAASRARGLPTWDKPAAGCLASRIALGVAVSRERLQRVDRAESAVRAVLVGSGVEVRNLRVRDLGDQARLEVDAPLVEEVAARPDVLDAVRDSGFDRVEVDPRGFRSGAIVEPPGEPDPYR